MLLSEIPSYFKARRDALIGAHPDAAFIFPSAPEMLRNPDVHFPFRQESSFHYLTGFDEPESFVVLTPPGSKPGGHRMTLFVRSRDPEHEMWEGERYGTDGAQDVFGAEQALPTERFEERLPELLGGVSRVFYRLGRSEVTDRLVIGALESQHRNRGRSGSAIPSIVDPAEALGELRLFKRPEEADALRRACQVSARAHREAMRECRAGMKEFEIEALLEYVMRRGGCSRLAYGSIVAGGRNAACLHYRANNDTLRDGELLLIDAGGEFDYYAADITRTFPIGSSFTPAQARVYDVVLRAQKECIALCKPGTTLPEIHRHAVRRLTEGLLEIGLLQGKLDELIQSNAHRRFYPHNTSHWLGMDVHDAGLYSKGGAPRVVEAGMCFTIEPGFYVQPKDTGVPAEFRDIGIRIEDDILITDSGAEVLTRDAPKERAELEALRKG